MDVADYVILVILLFSAFDGYRTGFVAQLVRLFGTVAAYVIAWKFSYLVKPAVMGFVRHNVMKGVHSTASIPILGAFDSGGTVAQLTNTIAGGLAFGIVFFAALIAIRFLGRLLGAVMSLPVLSFVNRVTGLCAGVVVAFLLIAVLINVAEYVPAPQIRQQIRHSALAPAFSQPVRQLERMEGLLPAHGLPLAHASA